MKFIELKPILIPTREWEEIEKRILAYLRKLIYQPLLKDLGLTSKILKNSLEDLKSALERGVITFSQGKFRGSFNSKISRELKALGATWDRGSRSWKILQKDLPSEVKISISINEARFQEKLSALDMKIAKIVPEAEHQLSIDKFFDQSLFKVNKSFEDAVKKITVAPQLSDESVEFMRTEWRENISKSIKGITEEVLPKLREEIQKNVYAGNRYEALIDTLEDSYSLSASRAKYVARNETNLMMAKFKETRLAEVGVYQYKWVCVHGTPDHQVRPIHRELNDRSKKGEIFDFRSPPIAEANGLRYNPHERNNCRCTSQPVFSFK